MTPKQLEHPDRLSAVDRATEITTILANAILRQHRANEPEESEFGLGFSERKSVHTTPLKAGEMP